MAEAKRNYGNIIAITIVVILAAGYYILRSNGVIMKERHFYAYFNDVKGLQASSAVQVNGVRVGKIADITLNSKQYIKLVLTVNDDVKLPQGTKAELSSAGLTGDKIINLIPGNGPGLLADETTLPTGLDTSVMPVSVQVTPYIETFKSILNASDITLNGINELIRTGTFTSFTNALISLETDTRSYAKLAAGVNKKSDEIVHTINDFSNSSAKLAAKNKDIRNTITNADSSTARLAAKPLRQNIESIQASLQTIRKSVKDINDNSKLLNDKKAYNDANASLQQTTNNMQSTMEHPKGFRIIGKSKK